MCGMAGKDTAQKPKRPRGVRRMGSPSPGVWAPLGSVIPTQGTLHIVLSSQTSESDISGEKVSDFKYT